LLADLDDTGTSLKEYLYLNGQLLAVLSMEDVQAGGEEFIVDNGAAGTSRTGSWTSKTSSQDYGSDYQLATKNTVPSTYRWSPTMPAGTYDVYAWWVSSSGHSASVPYTIVHQGQTDAVTRSHQQGGGSWQLLGTYTFDGAGTEYVEVSNANGKAAADAIKLVKEVTTTTQTNRYYVHHDQLGTPQAMTDENANVVWRASYDPFGKASIDAASTATLNVRFPGQYYDQETGLHYNYFRYYDPSTGRYITIDPIGLTGGVNPYLYANANPIRFTDPLGLLPCTCRAIGGGTRENGQKICTYKCECNDKCGKLREFTYKFSAGASGTATCIGQVGGDPFFPVPRFDEFKFVTDSILDRVNPFSPPNDFMDGIDRRFDN
jgi:RHS repeat-associated protein